MSSAFKKLCGGVIVKAPLNDVLQLKCTTAGTTSSSMLDCSNSNIGDTITDGSVTWLVEKDNNQSSFDASTLLDLIHPVGSLYWSKNSTSPATLFGGTWTQIKDKFILAVGDTYGEGTSGGSATVTLTTEQIPEHSHSGWTDQQGNHAHTRGTMDISGAFVAHCMTYNGSATSGALYGTNTGYMMSNGSGTNGHQLNLLASRQWSGETSYNGTHAHNVGIGVTGGGQAHDNMPPYVAYYCWERTA